jgi:hypothetical protein
VHLTLCLDRHPSQIHRCLTTKGRFPCGDPSGRFHARLTIPLEELERAVAVLRPDLADSLAECLAILWSRRMLRRFGTDYAINVDIHEWRNPDGTRFISPAVAEFLFF